jgi:hypothetical protein
MATESSPRNIARFILIASLLLPLEMREAYLRDAAMRTRKGLRRLQMVRIGRKFASICRGRDDYDRSDGSKKVASLRSLPMRPQDVRRRFTMIGLISCTFDSRRRHEAGTGTHASEQSCTFG